MKTRLLTFFPENQQPRQFTPLREGRLLDFLHRRVSVDISIHAPPRGATRGIGDINTTCNISIHAPPRGATHPRGVYVLGIGISIHAPPRGATPAARRTRRSMYFNSRPSARGDSVKRIRREYLGTFQFTPLREGRRSSSSSKRRFKAFQFTPLREGRLTSDFANIERKIISIHAPPRGATLFQVFCIPTEEIFQFTPLREGRRMVEKQDWLNALFQFTPLREGRR